MIALDSIIVILIVLGALAYLGRRYYKKWKSPQSMRNGKLRLHENPLQTSCQREIPQTVISLA